MHAYRDPLPGSPPTTQPGAPPAYLEEYQRVCKVPKAPKFRQPPPSLAMANYVQSDVNPSVALDKESKKYRILLFKDGIPTAMGMFNTGEECIEGYWGVKDRMQRGTLAEPQRHGVEGVPRSSTNLGPPGAALQPPGTWQKNGGNRPRPSTSLLHSMSYGQGNLGPLLGMLASEEMALRAR